MTNKEAIKGLKALSKEFSGYKPNEEMFDMAIKALELVTINSDSNEIKVTNCNYKDTIYRQAAIEAVSDCGICIQRIVDLPSVQPERRKGRWRKGVCECGYDWAKDAPISSVPNFCPQCGADKRQREE